MERERERESETWSKKWKRKVGSGLGSLKSRYCQCFYPKILAQLIFPMIITSSYNGNKEEFSNTDETTI